MGNTTSCFVDVFEEAQGPSTVDDEGTPVHPTRRRTPRTPRTPREPMAARLNALNGDVPEVPQVRLARARVGGTFGRVMGGASNAGQCSGRMSTYSMRCGWVQAELQSNLKELDRILTNLEEDLQELHTTPATATGKRCSRHAGVHTHPAIAAHGRGADPERVGGVAQRHGRR
jgi:hypothetical protein